ncbi:MAG TPA: type I-U CRISPR-associated protein Csb2 [Candidatus Micrarchaeia archaeon]|nr:type I-U CRISPR-associated protein Csb2 [Candidatus Micrarchaeia archaeon]
MLVISVELLHGTIRATGAADTSITGQEGAGEWPPSPARLFSALVAADGTGDRQQVTDGTELRLLERSRPPRIIADGLERVVTSNTHDRFVVRDAIHIDNSTRETSAVHEYPGRGNEAVRGGLRLAPASPSIVYIWDDLEVDLRSLRALALRASRVGYLGCSDSPARVTVSREVTDARDAWTPDNAGPVTLPVPYEGFLNALDEAFGRFQQGEAVRRAWIPNHYMCYRPPGRRVVTAPQPTVTWLRFDAPVSGRHLLAVTETLRAALLERYTLEVGGDSGLVPNIVSGHGFQGDGYHHAYCLALPEVGHARARGRLHGAAIVLPPGTDGEVVETVRAALWRITTLARPRVFETTMRLYGGERRPVAATPERWQGPARRWVSATPILHERFQRVGPGLDEVGRWCAHAGVQPRPVWYRTSRVPLVEGALCLAPTEVYRAGRERRPYGHLAIVFDAPVRGPLVLGGARQFGFGLMLPQPSPGPSDG